MSGESDAPVAKIQPTDDGRDGAIGRRPAPVRREMCGRFSLRGLAVIRRRLQGEMSPGLERERRLGEGGASAPIADDLAARGLEGRSAPILLPGLRRPACRNPTRSITCLPRPMRIRNRSSGPLIEMIVAALRRESQG